MSKLVARLADTIAGNDLPPKDVKAVEQAIDALNHCENLLLRYEINDVRHEEIADAALAMIRGEG